MGNTYPSCEEHRYHEYTREYELLHFTSGLPEKLVMQKPPEQWCLHRAEILHARTGLLYCVSTSYIHLYSANASFSRK